MPQLSLDECVSASLLRVCGADVVRDVRCESHEGKVTLTGSVSNREDLAMCGTVARTVPNVRSVDNQLTVADEA
ncbi:BON domain-containing protein [Roseimaritima ulvae]|uniref:Periplasmic protein n=1 Tax=Roseimaritima ulvae TaxID=980254 RepID=A0A5B9R5N1_9BACT|nr:BON domain-containing protein [Roseimaritima ulvae]QEG41533.1 periplasmic protein [Roseimaritima ulvae]